MKLLIIIAMLGLTSCSTKVIVKDCSPFIADYLECELVRK